MPGQVACETRSGLFFFIVNTKMAKIGDYYSEWFCWYSYK